MFFILIQCLSIFYQSNPNKWSSSLISVVFRVYTNCTEIFPITFRSGRYLLWISGTPYKCDGLLWCDVNLVLVVWYILPEFWESFVYWPFYLRSRILDKSRFCMKCHLSKTFPFHIIALSFSAYNSNITEIICSIWSSGECHRKIQKFMKCYFL